MARTRSQKVHEIKAKLIGRLRDGFYRPGDRFLSGRALAMRFGVSYQTAHRLMSELAEEGWIERRAASGSYIPGSRAPIEGVELIFHPRARRKGSFGRRLMDELIERLRRDSIAWKTTWAGPRIRPRKNFFSVIWECSEAIRLCVAGSRAALLLNNRPPSGVESVFIDSVSTDDFSGGASAAQLLQQKTGARRGFAILSGPFDDARSELRVRGFRSIAPARKVAAHSWFYEDAYRRAGAVLDANPKGVFCCNDRLAEALLAYARQHAIVCPPVVGFDDAPIAERLNLTTIAIPWEAMLAGAMATIRRRLSGDRATPSQQIFTPIPIVRN